MRIALFVAMLSLSLYAATNATVTQVQSTYDASTTLDIFIDLNNTPNPTITPTQVGIGFGNCPNDQNCYTGAIFKDYNTLTLNNNATLTVNLTAAGYYGGWAGVFFRGGKGDQTTYTMNGGTFVLNLISYPNPHRNNPPVEGVFMTRGTPTNNEIKFIFNSNIAVKATKDFYITRGIFNVNDGKGGYQFNKNVFIDVADMPPSEGWQGSGVGYKSITSISGDGYFYINYDPQKKTTYNINNIVQLKGDIAVEINSSEKSEAIIHLTNPQSYFQGRFSLQGNANAELLLDHGGKWFLTTNSSVRTLKSYNQVRDIQNQYGNIDRIAVVDFIKVADDGVSSRLTSEDAFKKRELNITRELAGENGIFRLMADIPAGGVDEVKTSNLNGNQYIQIYQNGARLSFDLAGKRLVVAHADKITSGDFRGLSTIAGIYNYDPILRKEENAGGGTDWILSQIQHNPNQTAKTLFNILSAPYRVFRIQADTINHRIDDLLYPPNNFGIWIKAYGGGIYQRNDFDRKQTSQNLFYALQGGFDYGRTNDLARYFYGGSFDFLKMYGSDPGYDGTSQSYALGFYGGYIYNDDLFLDANIKYVFTQFNNTLYQAQDPVNFNGHMFIGHFRLGYSFYPFINSKGKVIELCKKGSDGTNFCRNGKSTGYVRDPSFFIQPFFSLTPGVVFGQHFAFIDKISDYNIISRLNTSPALITKVGVLGVKRYEYDTYAVRARTFLSYSYDMNLGGSITLVDNANIPLESGSKHGSHRISLGLGSDVYFFNDSLRFYVDFSTEFLSRLNTYWLFSGGLRYKFGQESLKRKGSLSYRPKSPAKKQNLKSIVRPYQDVQRPEDSSFSNQNHFKESSGFLRPQTRRYYQ